ncbi:MAG: proprotein convertase P-domain-containing protein [Planctomycetota bacterium]|jgi:subtilisin-like proprotein convertase family protein
MRRFNPKVVLVLALVISIGAAAPALGEKGGNSPDQGHPRNASAGSLLGVTPPKGHSPEAPGSAKILVVEPVCEISCPIDENEPNCGVPDTFNGGCNIIPPAFSPIELGDTYCGTASWDGGTRDTDWYEVVVTEETTFTWTVEADFHVLMGLVETIPVGSDDCADLTGGLVYFEFGVPCEVVSVTTDVMPPGTYWFFVAPDWSLAPPFDCNDYVATLTGEQFGTGACCLGTRCADVNEAECAEMGGWYSGGGTQCTTASPMVYWDRLGLEIPDNNLTGVSHTINVPDSFPVQDVDIDVMIDHTFIGDLWIEVEHLGTTVLLWTFVCPGEDMDVIFDDEGVPVVCDSPTVGNIWPSIPLALFDGMPSDGDWTITVWDLWPFSTGTLEGWSVHLTPPAADPIVYWAGVPIPDDNDVGVSRTITVPDSFTLADVDIDVMIDHIWIGDLEIEIEHLGQTVTLWNHDCDFGNQFEDVNVIFDDEGNTVECNSPTVGNIIPAEALWVFDGMDAAGDWTITIRDTWAAFTGSLVRWSLHLDKPAPAGDPTIYLADMSLAIPDNNVVGVSHTINVPDACTIADVNIDVKIEHTYIWDLVIEVEHLGKTVVLWNRDCGGEDDMDVVFDDEGSAVVCASPTVGNILPAELLSAFDGDNAAGDWTITVRDEAGFDTGTLVRWSVHIEPTVGSPTVHFGYRGLPIPDDNDVGVSHTIDVPDSFTLSDVDVDVMIEHTYIWDLLIEVEHLGTTVMLWAYTCGDHNDIDVIFDDEGNTVECNSPTVGNVIPAELLSAFNGMDSAGEWTITVRDFISPDEGTLLRWSLHLDGLGPCSEPPVPAEMKFTPQALNTCSGGTAKAHFVLPDMYDPCDIADWLPARLRLLDMETLSEEIKVIAGRKKTALNKIMFTFDRAPFCTLETDEPYADVTVFGWLTSGQPFMGTDTIKIITNPQQFLAVLGSYWLSPDCGEADSCNEFDLNGDSVVNFADFAIQQKCFEPIAELENPK